MMAFAGAVDALRCVMSAAYDSHAGSAPTSRGGSIFLKNSGGDLVLTDNWKLTTEDRYLAGGSP